MKEMIINDLQTSYGILCESYEPVFGGWMNEKWKVSSPQGIYLVKEFSLKRFSMDKLHNMEKTLHAQVAMWEAGIPCSRILLCKDRTIRFLNDEHVYMVMEYVEGHQETDGSITLQQMHSLGETAYKMREVFNTLPPEQVLNYPQTTEDLAILLQNHYKKCLADTDKTEAYAQALEMMEPIMETLSLADYEMGIGHEDFAWDNMLFDDEKVAAILDFDRVQYGLKLHDIGRALMSYAFDGERLSQEKIDAFAEGYGEPLDVEAALRAVFYIEMPWWISAGMFQPISGKILRFRDEVLWLAEHWEELGSYSVIPPEWKVYYDGGFYEYHGRSKAGIEMPLAYSMAWGDEIWHIPSIYSCGKGLVVDFCVNVDTEAVNAYMEKWDLLHENENRMSMKEQAEAMRENPLDLTFTCDILLNGKTMRNKTRYSEYWIPGVQEMQNRESRWILKHYNLDPRQCWSIHRVSIPWATSRRPEIQELMLHLKPNRVPMPAARISSVSAGNEYIVKHPVDGMNYTLVVDRVSQETLDTTHMPSDMEYPTQYTEMCYHWKESDTPQVRIQDSVQGDSPRKHRSFVDKKAEVSDAESAAIAIIGGADGPTAIYMGAVTKASSNIRTAVSSLHFEPCQDVTWEVVFMVKPRDDLEIELI